MRHRTKGITINAIKIDKKVISAESFLNMSSEDRSNVAHTRIVPPKIGGKDFGFIEIQLKHPEYAAF